LYFPIDLETLFLGLSESSFSFSTFVNRHQSRQNVPYCIPVIDTAATMSGVHFENSSMATSEDTWDPEMADMINPHWKLFHKPSLTLNVTVGVFCLILGIVGLIGNSIVIYIFSK
jgi:hypothetical protein